MESWESCDEEGPGLDGTTQLSRPARSACSRRNPWARRTLFSASWRWRCLRHSWLSELPRLSRTTRGILPRSLICTTWGQAVTRAEPRAMTITTACNTPAAAFVRVSIRTNTFRTVTRLYATALTSPRGEAPHLRRHLLPRRHPRRRHHRRLTRRPPRRRLRQRLPQRLPQR